MRRRRGSALSTAASMCASHQAPGWRPRQRPHQGASISLQGGGEQGRGEGTSGDSGRVQEKQSGAGAEWQVRWPLTADGPARVAPDP